jgi:hypothetical protein
VASALEGICELRDVAGDGIVFHEEFSELGAFGDEEVDGLVERLAGEIDGPDEVLGAGGDVEVVLFAVDGEDVELPDLPAVEEAEAFGVDGFIVEIDDAGDADVLFDPGVFDSAGVDAVEAFGKVAEGAVGHFLDFEDVRNLVGREDALFDQQLANLDAGQNRLFWGNIRIRALVGVSVGRGGG